MNNNTLVLGRWKDYNLPSLPDLLDIPRRSFEWLLREGIDSAFRDFFPIETDKYIVEYINCRIGTPSIDDIQLAKYTLKTYSAPVFVKLRIVEIKREEKDGRTIFKPVKVVDEDELKFFDLPLITDRATFVVNGTERVFINQLIRSSGIYFFREEIEKVVVYKTTVIPSKGSIIELETELQEKTYPEREIEKIKTANYLRVKLDKKIKFTFVTLLKALGFNNENILEELVCKYVCRDYGVEVNQELIKKAEEYIIEQGKVDEFIYECLLKYIYDNLPENRKDFTYDEFLDAFQTKHKYLPYIVALVSNTIERDIKRNKIFGSEEVEKAMRLIHRRMTGENTSTIPLEVIKDQIFPFFSRERYDISIAGRYKIYQRMEYDIVCWKCGLINKNGQVNCKECGERLFYSTILLDAVKCSKCNNPNYMDLLLNFEGKPGKIHFKCEFCDNDLSDKVLVKFETCGSVHKLSELDFDGEYLISPKTKSKTLLRSFVYKEWISLMKLHLEFLENRRFPDDTNSLANRRVRPIGEHLYNVIRAGLYKFSKLVKDKLTQFASDESKLKVFEVVNPKPIGGIIKVFFAQNSLSQFLDQTNPLSELTHKRRLSALGVGGIQREQANFEIRDIHPSHYSRICPVETPEGQNIGLITSLTTYASINYPFGFLVAPYYRVKDGVIDFSRVYYLDALEEENYRIAPADTNFDIRSGVINDEKVSVRYKGSFTVVSKNEVDYIEISPIQILSVSASLIPFIENDDINRALMGANMQRQAVPLITPEKPLIFTGIEKIVATNSGYSILAKRAGEVVYVDSEKVIVKTSDGDYDTYTLKKYVVTNSATTINQKVYVNLGDKVKEGDIIAAGFAIDYDELALGRNVLVAYMPWEGFNFEDAIVFSEEVIRNNWFTSIHIEEKETIAVNTKQGPEMITRDIGNISEQAVKDLDEEGIIRVGAEVKPGDILVGKVTPQSETELTPEEKLLQAIFGKNARNAKDTSLRASPGLYGKVIRVFNFKPEDVDTDNQNFIRRILIHIAQRRNIKVGDKVALRHGNKGVISLIAPIEDMPFMADGTPIQVILNPLGVPSRMNIGQIFEAHLGLVCKILNIRIKVPSFSSLDINTIKQLLKEALKKQYMELKGDKFRGYDDYEMLIILMRHSGYTVKHLINMLGLTREEIIRRMGNKKEFYTYSDSKLAKMFTVRDLTVEEVQKLYDMIIDDLSKGKFILYDGKTGDPFDRPVTVGYVYMMKLIHMVEDKIHARSLGPYSLITKQPLGGRAQNGGQRFGEMEVWALEAHGASYSLHEMLTIKSDDVIGRNRAYESIIKGKPVRFVGIPESFKVLVKELQALGLDIEIVTDKNTTVIPKSFEAFEGEEETIVI
ncbi:MAG: DNA-directed RNA polymerase subunit beta [Candidatus Calescibacterium sp.]|nr:DNA-directed RNA polymerase subunit beta [Candidatus Calescibacterium sp.]MCX7971766.1 DNA-directed RNA polymerase subunit beta [bacterium]MDW8195372.1 DNA-directed RNA polymerase subunit beta [Candidatus Calescibacterium sp.]